MVKEKKAKGEALHRTEVHQKWEVEQIIQLGYKKLFSKPKVTSDGRKGWTEHSGGFTLRVACEVVECWLSAAPFNSFIYFTICSYKS